MLAPRVAEQLRARGISVSETGTRARGVPDLIVDAWGLCVVGLEVDRDRKERVIPQELAFRATWAGLDVLVARSEGEALEALLSAYATVATAYARRASLRQAELRS